MSLGQIDFQSEPRDTLTIYTLGNFHVFRNGCDLTDSLDKSIKVWDLFKYFLTYRDELILPEKIIESLWSDTDLTDPKRTLRALIFRLRKALEWEGQGDEHDIIIYSHGCYKYQSTDSSSIDVVQFEQLFRKAYETADSNKEQSIDIFKRVIAMYKGDYLSDTAGHDWLIPARNYYRRIYLQAVYEAAELMQEVKRYPETLTLCEQALKHELYDEELHRFYIEALAGTGKIKQARNHYEYVKELFEKELGVEPTGVLLDVYRMLFGEMSRTGLDMNYIKENLREETMPHSPMLCDREFFKALHQLEARRAERYGTSNYLGVLTLLTSDHTLPEKTLLEEGMRYLRQLLLTSLRKGDVISEWNEAQFLLSLPALNDKQAQIPMKRVQKAFNEAYENFGLAVYFRIQDTLPPENYQ